jgi:hypothetical protein
MFIASKSWLRRLATPLAPTQNETITNIIEPLTLSIFARTELSE